MGEEKILFHREVGMILDSAIEVYRVLGHGLLEKPYENERVREFGLRGILFGKQPRYLIDYKGCQDGEFVADLVAFELIVSGHNTSDHIFDIEIAQMLTYLRVGFFINFDFRRIIL